MLELCHLLVILMPTHGAGGGRGAAAGGGGCPGCALFCIIIFIENLFPSSFSLAKILKNRTVD